MLDLSCLDWRERLSRRPVAGADAAAAESAAGDRAVAVFNRLRLADVPGTRPWGGRRGVVPRHRPRAVRCARPGHEGAADPRIVPAGPEEEPKTTNGALLMLTALLLNERPRHRSCSPRRCRRPRRKAFSALAGAIALDPVLDRKLHVRDHLKQVVHRETGARLEVMTFDPAIITGRKVVGALIDEPRARQDGARGEGDGAAAGRHGAVPRVVPRHDHHAIGRTAGGRVRRRPERRARCATGSRKARSCRCCTSSRWRNRGQDKPLARPEELAAGHAERWPVHRDRPARGRGGGRGSERRGGVPHLGVAAPEHSGRRRACLRVVVGAEVWEQNGSTG